MLPWLTSCEGDKVPVDSPSPDPAARVRCEQLLDALPDTVADELRRPVDPDDALGAAWGDPAIVLTCGVARPAGFDRFSSCQVVDGVGWFVPDDQLYDDHTTAVLTAVSLRPLVQVEVPAAYRENGLAAPMVDLAPALKSTLHRTRTCS